MKSLRTLNRYFYKYKMRFLFGIVFVCLVNFFKILSPQFIREALDMVFRNLKLYAFYKNTDWEDQFVSDTSSDLVYFAGAILLAAFCMSIFMFLMRQTIIVMSRFIEYDLRKEIFSHYEKLSTSFYKQNNTGDLMARISEDVSKVRNYLGPAVMYAINLVALVAFCVYSMLQVSTTLTLASLLPLPFLSIMIYFVSSMINKQSTKIQEKLSELTSSAQEVFSGIRVVKSYVQDQPTHMHYEMECEDYKKRSLKLASINAFFFPAMVLMIGTSTIITVYVGGLEVAKGNITTGNIAEFVIYVSMLTWPFTSIGWIASIIQQAAASMTRINEFLKIEPEIQNPTQENTQIDGDIVFENVSFTYPENGVQALKNVNFTIKKGQKFAIVGPTGSGKTTIVELLLRMYDVTEGRILINGQDIKTLNLDTLRSKIGYIPQDVFLFSDTVAENIKFGKRNASQDEVLQYAKYASLHDEILTLSDGYDTVVGERGVTLSGGQKQRISIARAFIKKPDVYILDDCLSAIDTKTEQKIATYIDGDLSEKTSIIITHRIYNGLKFDKIMAVMDGEISQVGTHEELMAMSGYYADMLSKQTSEVEE